MRTNMGLAPALIALALTTPALTGCGKGGGGTGNTAAAAAAAADGKAEAGEVGKWNAYTEAFNRLIDDVPWNLRKTAEELKAFDLSRQSKSGSVSYPETTSLLEAAVRDLRRGRAQPATAESGAADAAADQLIRASDTLLARWRELKPYFDSRGYRDDDFARAKAADPEVRQAMGQAIAGLDALEKALSAHQRAEGERKRDAYKAAGNMPAYRAADAMLIADRFADAANGGHAPDADAMLPQVTKAIEDLRVATAALPATDRNRSSLDTMVSSLSQMVGDWRDSKDGRDASEIKSLIGNYNDAVKASNDLDFNRES